MITFGERNGFGIAVLNNFVAMEDWEHRSDASFVFVALTKRPLQNASETIRIPRVGIASANRLVRTAAFARARFGPSGSDLQAQLPRHSVTSANRTKSIQEKCKAARTICIIHNVACSMGFLCSRMRQRRARNGAGEAPESIQAAWCAPPLTSS